MRNFNKLSPREQLRQAMLAINHEPVEKRESLSKKILGVSWHQETVDSFLATFKTN